jgi:hypothetical protein
MQNYAHRLSFYLAAQRNSRDHSAAVDRESRAGRPRLRTTPGLTASTRSGANSTASALVNPLTAPQMLAATAQPGPARAFAIPVVSVIAEFTAIAQQV